MTARAIGQGIAAFILAVLAAAPAPAGAADAAGFYSGKTLTYIVAASPGGSYDFYGRLVARHMARHLPGVAIAVRNLPGKAHVLGANVLYEASPDGLTIGTFSTGLIYDQLIGREGANFDLSEMSWIGKAASDPRILIVGINSPIHTLKDLHQPGDPFLFAVARIGSLNYNETKILQAAVGFNASIISGYKSTDDELAIENHSIDAVFGPKSRYGSFVSSGKGRAIFQVGGSDPDVPQLSDLIGRTGSADAKAVVALIRCQADLARLTAGPPGIPVKRLEILRSAYRAALESPALRAEAAASGRAVVPFAVGDDVAREVDSVLDQSPETIAAIAQTFLVRPPTLVAKAPRAKPAAAVAIAPQHR
jgi:tripartite-type tricarboxylate transporter receptor subunit TctC